MTDQEAHQQINANREEMKQHFKTLGFSHLCHISGDGKTECYSNLEGMYVTVNTEKRTFELSVIDGMIECKITNLSFPNQHTPHLIKQLQRHIF